MIFDTDILIWLQRGNTKAELLVENEKERYISVLTYMELLQGAQNKHHQRAIQLFFQDYGFITLPLSENIGHRAAVLIDQYSLSHGLRAGDAIIAATAAENQMLLCTANVKHFKPIRNLQMKIFVP